MSKAIVQSAAGSLLGLTLPTGWHVVKHLRPEVGATGGHFSEASVADKADGRRAFLKALDFSSAFGAGVDTVRVLGSLTAAYEHERDVLMMCAARKLSNVVVAIDHGFVDVPGYGVMAGRVYYLVFELADGDIRGQVAAARRLDSLWSLRALKDVCLGLWQVHQQLIAHQDLKPSNVLVFGHQFQIADFGRCSMKGRSITHDDYFVAGDKTYAPPEQLYQYVHPEFNVRRFGCDMYMLGNLAAFLFAGCNVTSSVLGRIEPPFHWRSWTGSYEEVLPYLRSAFAVFLTELERVIEPDAQEFVIAFVQQLCDPDLMTRGHPRGLGRHDQHTLQRYVSLLDRACKKMDITIGVKGRGN